MGIETHRGLLVTSLVAAGYQVYAVNPRAVDRYRDRHAMSGAKSDVADAKMLADLVRTDRHNHRQVAGDSDLAEAIKVTARAHQSLIWTRQRQVNQLRSALREYYPGALAVFGTDPAHRDAVCAAKAVAALVILSCGPINLLLPHERRPDYDLQQSAIDPDFAALMPSALNCRWLGQPGVYHSVCTTVAGAGGGRQAAGTAMLRKATCMRTVLMVIGIWVGASMFTAVVFAVGARMGHRLAVDAFRQAGVQEQDQVPLDAT